MNKLETAKRIIEENIEDAECGIFDSRNITGDRMNTIFNKDGLQIDVCFHWSYFEVFGLSRVEFSRLKTYYYDLLRERDEKDNVK